MSITVNTNMSSLICQRSLTKATSGMNTALQRMSTGLKINSAKDDAAGCAISSKMDYKLSSYGVAQDNAQMGQSMLDTASGSLSVMNNMLQRMRDLSEQAANGTYGKEERQAMQAEVDALTKELYRIKNTTDFNGKKVLGEEEGELKPTIRMADITDLSAVSTSEIIGISTAAELAKLAELTNNGVITKGDGTKTNITEGKTFAITADIDLSSIENWNSIGIGEYTPSRAFRGTFDGNGHTISNLTTTTTENCNGLFGTVYEGSIKNINIENGDVAGPSRVGILAGKIDGTTIDNCHVSGIVNGTGYSAGLLVGWSSGSSSTIEQKISNCTAEGTVTGNMEVGGFIGNNHLNTKISDCWCSATVTGKEKPTGGFTASGTQNNFINCSYDKSANINNYPDAGRDTSVIIPDSKNPPSKNETKTVFPINLQVGINSDSNSIITTDTGFEIGTFKISLETESGAKHALQKIDAMMAKVNAKQLDIGATSNRLASTMEFQEVQMSALTSANSLIKDADIAKESASYIKNQILQQTTATLLATANQNPSIALSLV